MEYHSEFMGIEFLVSILISSLCKLLNMTLELVSGKSPGKGLMEKTLMLAKIEGRRRRG